MNFVFVFTVFMSGVVADVATHELKFIVETLDLPRPFLDKRAYMQCVYTQAIKLGANDQDLTRLHQIAYSETRENPRLCVPGGCGPFQHEVHRLVPKPFKKFPIAHAVVRWLLTNKPGFAARTTLDLLHRCEKLSGEHWRCCYGGAYRPMCRIKWDRNYRPDFVKESEEET